MLNNSQIILALTGVAAACLVANGLAEVGLILIIAVAVSLAASAVIRRHRRHRRAQRNREAWRAWQQRHDPRSTGSPSWHSIDLIVIDEASFLFGGHPSRHDSVVWPVDLTQGPELKPWPKDGDALFGHRSPSEKAAEVLRRLRQVEPDFILGTIEGNPNAVEWRIKPDPELKDEDGGKT